eukprot:767067-Hanusia_phi.AAC.1
MPGGADQPCDGLRQEEASCRGGEHGRGLPALLPSVCPRRMSAMQVRAAGDGTGDAAGGVGGGGGGGPRARRLRHRAPLASGCVRVVRPGAEAARGGRRCGESSQVRDSRKGEQWLS